MVVYVVVGENGLRIIAVEENEKVTFANVEGLEYIKIRKKVRITDDGVETLHT